MLALAAILFTLLLIGVPIAVSLAGATSIMVMFDDFLTFGTLYEAFFLSLIHI